jgi:enamine deaminase RidA (YjgF/YER057c/UK114 family)
MKRKNISTGAPWEDIVGYSRAVCIGSTIEVTGTVATEGGEVIGKGDPYLQTKAILEKIGRVLEEAGASMEDIVRTRIFVTNIEEWEAIGKAHRELLGHVKPATTMVEVSRLIHPDYLVEIEATAVKDSE